MLRSRLLYALVGLAVLVVIALTWRTAISASAATLTGKGNDRVEANSVRGDPATLSSAAEMRLRAEIPSDFVQPVVTYDPSAYLQDSMHPVGAPTLRDEIPSDFIYPLGSNTAQNVGSPARSREGIPSDFVQPVAPYDPSEVSPGESLHPVGPHSLRDEIPSDFLQPVLP